MFLKDFKESFRENAYVSDLSLGQATSEYLKLFTAPFIIAFILGMTSLISSPKWNSVFLNAIDEFMQITGLKLSLYLVVGLLAVSFILYEVPLLTRLIAWLVRTLSHSAFAISSVLSGVFTGISIPAAIDRGSYEPLIQAAIFLPFYTFVTLVFYLSAVIFRTSVRTEIDNTLGRHTKYLVPLFGIILFAVFWNGMFLEETWTEVSKN